jgi:hypothetical protein
MRRLGLMGVVAVPLLVGALASVPSSAGASAVVKRPGLPTVVRATSVYGVPGVSVSWGQPVSDGSSPIQYYVASSYSGKYYCISLNPGPDTCNINGFKDGSITHNIRVRAVSAAGGGQTAAIFSVVTHPNPDNGGSAGSPASGTNQAATGLPSSASTSGDATASGTSPTGTLAFTGANFERLFIVGAGLLLGGLFLLSPIGRRRRVLPQTASGLIAPLR